MSERTPLLAPPPTTVDTSIEAQLDAQRDDGSESSTIRPESPTCRQEFTFSRIVLATISLALLIFLQATNVLLLTTIQSEVVEEIQAADLASWFTSAYLIAASSLGPVNGRLAGIFTPRVCIAAASIFFALGSFVTGLSTHFSTFILGRTITGIGASGIFTVSIIVVLDLASAEARGLAVGLVNTGFTIGVAVGATAAGALLPIVGWRWLFLAQTPVALLSGFVLYMAIPSSFTTGKQSTKSLSSQLGRIDYLGAFTLTLTIVLVLYSLSAAKEIPLLPLFLAPITLAAFLAIEIYVAAEPIIPLTLLKSRGLLLSCLATVGYMTARWVVLFYTPVFAMAVRGKSPASAGSVLVPTNAGFALGGLVVGWLHIRRQGSFYLGTLISYAIFPLTMLWMAALVSHDSSLQLFIFDVFLCGFTTGAALNYTLAHVLHLTPKSTHYVATSLLATFRGFSGSFGSAIGGGYFTRTLYNSLTARFAEAGLRKDDLVQRLLGSPALVQKLEGVEKAIAMASYEDALRALFYAAAAVAGVTVLIQAGTGWKAGVEPQEDRSEQDANP